VYAPFNLLVFSKAGFKVRVATKRDWAQACRTAGTGVLERLVDL
jgi:hypothetical protein